MVLFATAMGQKKKRRAQQQQQQQQRQTLTFSPRRGTPLRHASTNRRHFQSQIVLLVVVAGCLFLYMVFGNDTQTDLRNYSALMALDQQSESVTLTKQERYEEMETILGRTIDHGHEHHHHHHKQSSSHQHDEDVEKLRQTKRENEPKLKPVESKVEVPNNSARDEEEKRAAEARKRKERNEALKKHNLEREEKLKALNAKLAAKTALAEEKLEKAVQEAKEDDKRKQPDLLTLPQGSVHIKELDKATLGDISIKATSKDKVKGKAKAADKKVPDDTSKPLDQRDDKDDNEKKVPDGDGNAKKPDLHTLPKGSVSVADLKINSQKEAARPKEDDEKKKIEANDEKENVDDKKDKANDDKHDNDKKVPDDDTSKQLTITKKSPVLDKKYSKKDMPVATIAYAISLVKCGDHQSTSAGLVDAALVMRHSIHLQSSRNPASGSKYDYHMYAIVHRDAVGCSGVLEDAGFTIVVKDPPIQPKEIKGEFLRSKIHKEWCCGHDEFIKLFAYELPGKTKEAEPEPIVVHADIDFAFYQPMDDLYDAILFDKDSPEGKAARTKIPLERPDDPLPDQIDAFITRDYPQLLPGRTPGYQAGWLVARRDTTVVPEVLDVIREGNYKEGFGRDNGWGAAGYGAYVGAMAMQGLMAYYYDMVRPNTSVEVNSCRFNHMGMDNLYRAYPNFKRNSPWVGKCRSTRPDCEDCTITDPSKIYNVHYTQCRKPWNCVSVGVGGGLKGKAIDTNNGNLEHCLKLNRMWHDTRKDLEDKLIEATGDKSIEEGRTGTYRTDVFLGHCTGEGGKNYTQIHGLKSSFKAIPSLYDQTTSAARHLAPKKDIAKVNEPAKPEDFSSKGTKQTKDAKGRLAEDKPNKPLESKTDKLAEETEKEKGTNDNKKDTAEKIHANNDDKPNKPKEKIKVDNQAMNDKEDAKKAMNKPEEKNNKDDKAKNEKDNAMIAKDEKDNAKTSKDKPEEKNKEDDKAKDKKDNAKALKDKPEEKSKKDNKATATQDKAKSEKDVAKKSMEENPLKPKSTEGTTKKDEASDTKDTDANRAVPKSKENLAGATPYDISAASAALSGTVIAYAVAIQECDRNSPAFLDSLMVLRYSIHKQSVRNPQSRSKYDYNLYALVDEDTKSCTKMLEKAGFHVVLEEAPPVPQSIGAKLLGTVFKNNEYSKGEFAQLRAFNLTSVEKDPEPITVVLNKDVTILKPLDILFDAMLLKKAAPAAKGARDNLPLERPDDALPDVIDAMFTRDYTHAVPTKDELPTPYQDGLIVARRSLKIFSQISMMAKSAHFTKGTEATSGWGGKGHLGAGMDGLIPYYFDEIRQNSAVELNSCRFNHIGQDNLYRAHPNFKPRVHRDWVGKCRSMREDCEDCLATDVNEIFTTHFTSQCHKPWKCVSKGAPGTDKGKSIDTTTGNLEHCKQLTKAWHSIRSELDKEMVASDSGIAKIHESNVKAGKYKPGFFDGHCKDEGHESYLPSGGDSIKTYIKHMLVFNDIFEKKKDATAVKKR